MALKPGRIGRRLNADRHHHAGVFVPRIDDGLGFFDGLGHRLFTINVLVFVKRVDSDFGVPMVRRGDDDKIDLIEIKKLPIILDDVLFVVGIEADFLGGRPQSLAIMPGRLFAVFAGDFVVVFMAVPDVANGDGGDAFIFFLQLGDNAEMSLTTAADADETDADAFIGLEDAAIRSGAYRQHGGACGRALKETTTVDVGFGHLRTPK